MRIRSRHASVLSVLSLAVLLPASGCGGGTEKGKPSAAAQKPTPAGFKRAETPDFSFAVPESWSVETRPAKSNPGEIVTEATGPKGTGAVVPLAIVGATPDYRSELEGLVLVNETGTLVHYPGSRQVSKKDKDVPGATGAKLIESTVSDPPPSGPGAATPVRMFDIVALSQSKTAVNLFVRVPVADFDEARVQEIIDSLELK